MLTIFLVSFPVFFFLFYPFMYIYSLFFVLRISLLLCLCPPVYFSTRSPVYPPSLELSAHKLHHFMFFLLSPLLSLYPIVGPIRAKRKGEYLESGLYIF